MAPEPPFFVQIVDKTGSVVVRTRAGGKHEADLVELCLRHILPRGVGVFRTNAQVEQAIRAGMLAALTELKVQDPFDVI